MASNTNPMEELIDFIIANEGKIDVNDVLVKAELINMRSRPRQVGWYHNGKLYRDMDDIKSPTMNDINFPKPLFYYPL